jgi:hypothetical protein
MIYPLAGLLIGAIFGGLMAVRKGGKRLDIIQWAAVNGIILGVIGMLILIFIERGNI